MITPVLPFGGVAGWNFLSRTMDSQKQAVAASPVTQREMTYFRERIGAVTEARELVEDFTLLKVALGAFGLQDDQPNRFFIRKVLEEGTVEKSSLANRLSDPRYKQLSAAFGFGDDDGPRTQTEGFADRILSEYRDQTFEVAVGKVDANMRLALGLSRELDRAVDGVASKNAQWFSVMGSPPLRAVFDTALGFPKSFAALDIDQQLSMFRARSQAVFGVSEVADFSDPEKTDALRTRFLLMSEIDGSRERAISSPVLSLFARPPGSGSILETLYSRR